jgi:3-oxoacyl-[acyl-carrier protein] reductase
MKNKNIIVTGCARGIGKEIVNTLSENGANVWACIRKPSEEFSQYCTELSQKYNNTITTVYCDFTDQEQIKTAAKTIMSDKKPIHGLVNNAGIILNRLFQMTSLEDARKQMDVNFFAPFLFTQYIVKIMIRQKLGSIVNISSTAAQDAYSGRSAYGSSKAAVICLTQTIAAELAEYNIRANAICPGITQTDMIENISQEVIQETINKTKLHRIGQPKDISNAVVFLLSDLSSYMTGQVLRVDGGM